LLIYKRLQIKVSKQCFTFKGNVTISICIFPLQLEQSLKGEEVVSKEIMAMSEEEIENEIKEVSLLCFLMSTLQK